MAKLDLWGWVLGGALLFAAVAAAAFSVFPYLWVLPLYSAGLSLWLFLVALDLALATSDLREAKKFRIFLWFGGLLYFSAAGGAPLLGVSLLVISVGLFGLARNGVNVLRLVVILGGAVLIFAHDSLLSHPGLVNRLGELRFSFRILALFGYFRWLSWSVAVELRGERVGFFATMEYFLAPAFWLGPFHSSQIVFSRMAVDARPKWSLQALGWIVRGLAHALLFGFVLRHFVPWLQGVFTAGFRNVLWWEWLLLGPAIFLLAYLEKSRVGFISAGILRIAGHDIEPDYRAPWLARNLLEYWRRFHYWIWEYYVEMIYSPLTAVLVRWLRPERVIPVAIFLTFAVGTTVSHYIQYPGTLGVACVLGLVFGSLTLLHFFAAPFLRQARVGIPLTWFSVFLLYILAYPSFGLGWGLAEWLEFIRK